MNACKRSTGALKYQFEYGYGYGMGTYIATRPSCTWKTLCFQSIFVGIQIRLWDSAR